MGRYFKSARCRARHAGELEPDYFEQRIGRKNQAETQKIRVETLKTQAELQDQLEKLQKSRADRQNDPALNDTLVKISAAIANIQNFKEAEDRGAQTGIVMRLVVVYFVLQAVGIGLSVF